MRDEGCPCRVEAVLIKGHIVRADSSLDQCTGGVVHDYIGEVENISNLRSLSQCTNESFRRT
jgi:hypothetical protein